MLDVWDHLNDILPFLGVAELIRVLGNPAFESEDDEVIDTYYP